MAGSCGAFTNPSKLERKGKHLNIKALYLEPGVQPDDELVFAVTASLRDFSSFHNVTDLAIDRSEPLEFGKKLLAVL